MRYLVVLAFLSFFQSSNSFATIQDEINALATRFGHVAVIPDLQQFYKEADLQKIGRNGLIYNLRDLKLSAAFAKRIAAADKLEEGDLLAAWAALTNCYRVLHQIRNHLNTFTEQDVLDLNRDPNNFGVLKERFVAFTHDQLLGDLAQIKAKLLPKSPSIDVAAIRKKIKDKTISWEEIESITNSKFSERGYAAFIERAFLVEVWRSFENPNAALSQEFRNIAIDAVRYLETRGSLHQSNPAIVLKLRNAFGNENSSPETRMLAAMAYVQTSVQDPANKIEAAVATIHTLNEGSLPGLGDEVKKLVTAWLPTCPRAKDETARELAQ